MTGLGEEKRLTLEHALAGAPWSPSHVGLLHPPTGNTNVGDDVSWLRRSARTFAAGSSEKDWYPCRRSNSRDIGTSIDIVTLTSSLGGQSYKWHTRS